MKRVKNYLLYLTFPIVGILIALLLPADKLPLRVLMATVITGIGVIAADAGFHLDSLKPSNGAHRITVALILMSFSAWTFSPEINKNHIFTLPVLLMLCGLVAVWSSVHFAPPPVQIAAAATKPLQPACGNLFLAFVGVLMLLAAAETSGQVLGIEELKHVPMAVQTLFFYGGITLLVLGLGGVRSLRLFHPSDLRQVSFTRPDVMRFVRRHKELLVVILIFVGAFVVRVWNLETGLRVSVDEALSIDGVGHYYVGTVGLVGRPSSYITSLLFPQWQGIIISLFGRSVTTLRLASVIAGSLTVVFTYFLGRDLFKDRRTGAVAALFLMTYPPHIHFSRISLLHIADPLFGTLAVWFLIRGIRWNRRLDWALGGAFLGLTQYFFEAGKLFYAPLAVTWLALAVVLACLVGLLKGLGHLGRGGWFARRRAARFPQIPLSGILIAALAFGMVAMPTYYSLFSRGGDANPRLTESGGFNLITEPFQDGLTDSEAVALFQRLFFPFTIFVHQPEIAVFYGGDQPLMLVYVVPFFLLGMAYLLWRWRSTAIVIVLWVLATAGTNALLRDSAVYARWHVVFPAIAIVVAVAVRYLLPMIWSRPASAEVEGERPGLVFRPLAVGLIAVVLAGMMIGQITYYYGWHVPLLEKQARLSKPYPDGFDMALRGRDLPSSTDIYQIGDPIPDFHVPQSWISFLTHSDPTTLRYFPMATQDVTPEFIDSLPHDRNLALFIDPHGVEAIGLIQNSFDCTLQETPYLVDPWDKAYLLCFVPSSEAPASEEAAK